MRLLAASAAVLALAGCVGGRPTPGVAPLDEARYLDLFPYYAETCALSQLQKKPGFGAEISSGIGGHAVLYLNGVCRRDRAGETLALCDTLPAPAADGVGLSVNAHYRNTVWVAVEDRRFFYDGGLKPGEALTRVRYTTALAEARARGIYDGVAFHDAVYDDRPAGETRAEFQYDVSAATDFAIGFGRNRYCARLPLKRAELSRIVDYLNALDRPYRSGAQEFRWNLLTHNCSHVNHNALAAVDLWPEWPMDRSPLISLFDFPVPKNEIVNEMRRTNDFPIDDPVAVWRDPAARAMLLGRDRLPTEPGALFVSGGIAVPNEVYDTTSGIIFYDDPITGSYQRRFDAIVTEPRYSSLHDNVAYFSALYRRIATARQPAEFYLGKGGIATDEAPAFRDFLGRYDAYIDRQIGVVDGMLARLDAGRS